MSNILTSEQVSRGYVDKICDQIADAIVTDCLHHDKTRRSSMKITRTDSFGAAACPPSFFLEAVWKR